jgi:hypothetical protein
MSLAGSFRGWIARLSVSAAIFGCLPAGAATAAQLTASWVDNSGGVALTRVERRHTSEASYTPVADADPGTASYVDTAVSAGATYCYRVFAWLDEAVSPYTEEVCATSAVDSVTVTVGKSGTGTGTVTSSPTGINCGASCSMAVTPGTLVTLTATPAAGSVFSGWSGAGCTGTGPCSFATNSSAAVTATFSPAPVTTPPSVPPTTYALVVAKSGPGVVTAPGISCGSDCSDAYAANTSVTLTATPNNGTAVVSWGGACAGTAATCTVAMDSAKSVSVTFRNGKGK